MSYKVAISENGSFVICKVTGQFTADVAKQFTIEMDRVSRASGIKRFLTDVRNAPNVSDVFQNYSFVNTDMTELKLQKDVRSAILVSATDTSHDFVETASRNAGYNVRVFDDEGGAAAWLSEALVASVVS
jgi:hypothetical protein